MDLASVDCFGSLSDHAGMSSSGHIANREEVGLRVVSWSLKLNRAELMDPKGLVNNDWHDQVALYIVLRCLDLLLFG